MYFIVIFLYKEDYLDDILEAFIELGIEDAVILNAETMKKELSLKVPLFAALEISSKEKTFAKVIMATADDKNVLKNLVKMLKQVDIDLLEEGICRMILLKAEEIMGQPEIIEEI